MQFDDVRVFNALDDQHFLCYHFPLLFRHVLYLDHLYGVALDLAILATLKDLGCGTRADLFD